MAPWFLYIYAVPYKSRKKMVLTVISSLNVTMNQGSAIDENQIFSMEVEPN